MIRTMICTLLAGWLAGAAAAEEPLKGDLASMQGAWKLTDADDGDGLTQKNGFTRHTMHVEGGRWRTTEPPEEVEELNAFRISDGGEGRPKRIDFTTADGRGKRLERVGIYRLKGDSLTIRFSTVVPKDDDRRPADFEAKLRRGEAQLVYERVKE